MANPSATAAAAGTTILFTATQADYRGNAVATSTTSAHASFGAATLVGGEVLSLDIKPQGEYDLTTVTLPSPDFIAPANIATGYYTGTMTTNTTEAIALLDPNNANGATPAATEPASEPLMAQLSWGAPNTLPGRSDEWTITIDNVVKHGGEGVPTDATNGPTVAQVLAAIAQAAAADTPAARNTAIATALAALPAPVNTSAAPIQPFSIWESVGYKFNNFSTGLNVENVGITSIAYGLIIQNASLQNAFGLSVRQNFAGNALDLATVNNGLATLDSLDLSNMIIDFSGGTNAAPTLDVAQVNGVGTLDFGSFDNAFTADGGQLADISFGLLYLFFDNSLPFSASAGCTDGRSGYICVQDNPAGSDIAAFIAANYSAPTLTLSAAGSVLSVTDATAGNLPLTFSDDAATGTVATITTPGNPPANSYALSIRSRGGTVITN